MRTAKIFLMCLITILALSAFAVAEPTISPEWWGKAPGQKPAAHGTVTNISPTNIAVQTKEGFKSFGVDDKTRVMIRGEKASITDVKVGDLVNVRFKLRNDNVPFAVGINVPKPTVKGKIKSIEGNVIILSDKDTEKRVVVSEKTIFVSHGYKGTIADLKVGYGVAARGNTSNNETTADTIEFVPAVGKGAVVAVDGNTITIKTVRQLTIITVANPNTAVLIKPRVGPNKPGTLGDIKVGMPVNIGFHLIKDGQSPLLWISALTGA